MGRISSARETTVADARLGRALKIYRELRILARGHACAILVTSAEPSELVGTCDRYLVLRHGRIVAELKPGEADEEHLLAIASAAETRASPGGEMAEASAGRSEE